MFLKKFFYSRKMANTGRCAVAGKSTHARDPQHMNARALPHVLTYCPPQVRGGERGEAGARDQHAVQQHFQHPQAHQLPHFLNTTLLVVSVTTPNIDNDGNKMTNGASASSHRRSCGTQRACLCSLAQAAIEQPVFAAQHAGECLEQHSAQHASCITGRRMRPASSIALALSMSRSSLWFV